MSLSRTRGMTPGLDVDLYANSGTVPTKASPLASKHQGTSDEFLEVANATSDVYVVAHSRSGQGVATLRFSRVHPSGKRYDSNDPIRVGFSFVPTTTQLLQLREVMADSQRALFGMTEGKFQVRVVEVYDDGPDLFGACKCGAYFCNVCVRAEKGRSYCNMVTKVVTLFGNTNTPEGGYLNPLAQQGAAAVVAHEWGHCLLGLRDEYVDHSAIDTPCQHSDALCLDSAMANPNLMRNLCDDLSHARDTGGHPARVGHVCASCPPRAPGFPGWDTCYDQCAICEARTTSAWQQVFAQGFVYSYPSRSQNTDPYFGHTQLPVTVYLR